MNLFVTDYNRSRVISVIGNPAQLNRALRNPAFDSLLICCTVDPVYDGGIVPDEERVTIIDRNDPVIPEAADG